MEDIYPNVIEDTSYKYILLDNKYISTVYIKEYPKELGFLELIECIPKEYVIDIAIECEKQNTMNILKKLSYQISNLNSEFSLVKSSQIDMDVLELSRCDAKALRKDIQVNNEEIFKTSFSITFFHEDLNSLYSLIKSFQVKLYSKQIITSISNFRHLNSYIKSLPYIDIDKKDTTFRFLTSGSLANICPFYTKSLLDKNGIVIGNIDENKLCILDIFDKKYINANMCIFGSSGSGKSFYTKLCILKHYLNGKYQLIFDPESEYENLINKLQGIYLTSSSKCKYYYNIMQIYQEDINLYGDNYLAQKIDMILNFIVLVIGIEKENEIAIIEEAIKVSYKNKGIDGSLNCIYKKDFNESKVYLKNEIVNDECFPCLYDVYNNIKQNTIKRKFNQKILQFIPCFCKVTNFDTQNSLKAIDLKCYDLKTSAIIIRYIINHQNISFDFYKDRKTIIYIDEAWKYIKNTFKNNISDLIFLMYKTIRKKSASIVLITQDMSDLFLGDNIEYAKSILNNSQFKLFFKMDYSDLEILKNVSVINKSDIINISKLSKGYMYLSFNDNNVKIKITASKFEEELLKGE